MQQWVLRVGRNEKKTLCYIGNAPVQLLPLVLWLPRIAHLIQGRAQSVRAVVPPVSLELGEEGLHHTLRSLVRCLRDHGHNDRAEKGGQAGEPPRNGRVEDLCVCWP